jgi:hypothetical protein
MRVEILTPERMRDYHACLDSVARHLDAYLTGSSHPHLVTPAKAGVHAIQYVRSELSRHASADRALVPMDPRFRAGDDQEPSGGANLRAGATCHRRLDAAA